MRAGPAEAADAPLESHRAPVCPSSPSWLSSPSLFGVDLWLISPPNYFFSSKLLALPLDLGVRGPPGCNEQAGVTEKGDGGTSSPCTACHPHVSGGSSKGSIRHRQTKVYGRESVAVLP